MSKKDSKKKIKKNSQDESMAKRLNSGIKNRQMQTILGFFLFCFFIFLSITFISFLFSWEVDQSTLSKFGQRDIYSKNIIGQIGAKLGHFFIYNGFGIAAFIIPYVLFKTGIRLLFNKNLDKIIPTFNWSVTLMILISLTLGYVNKGNAVFSGIIGYELNDYLQIFLGKTGLLILIVFLAVTYLIIKFKITGDTYMVKFNELMQSFKNIKGKTIKKPPLQSQSVSNNPVSNNPVSSNVTQTEEPKKEEKFSFQVDKPVQEAQEIDEEEEFEEPYLITRDKEEELEIFNPIEEKHVSTNLSDQLVNNFGEFDPTLDLSDYKFPTFNLLKQYSESISIDPIELEANKDKIVETLKNYKIGIDKIKATVGPTITLYEIIPEAGIRISKIKNLEDDIALSLSALGIRIIAPIPGKGTIGIEVPNKKATIVSMHSAITSKKFQESQMELPLALGKTISNETFVVDLAKMPHLLMAGATGQGKSVGLNAILTSLLYKKHPAEVKFILVDPKKVELTLFNKIERHYLAKLPDSEEAIITDNTKVINTLNSLCIEMDNRYELLKAAMVRNIKEYNAKFKQRKLNPENGHRFLPYIVLVIDEFADLIMTAGKEVETPIARLAQLARAIGIHLIVATQRPSVNVITGIIKANFPARVAFRVTSKIDSKTILDGNGADQLIGRGDMLYSGGNDLTRIQCAFVDTPEVEKITDFIGSQRAYPEAYMLPEYVGEESGTNLDVDISERDKLFKDAAEVIVIAQQGSTSLLQRKLKLGYNRAGRIIDQLEAAGIVGSFEGSKARQVLVPDLESLERLLASE